MTHGIRHRTPFMTANWVMGCHPEDVGTTAGVPQIAATCCTAQIGSSSQGTVLEIRRIVPHTPGDMPTRRSHRGVRGRGRRCSETAVIAFVQPDLPDVSGTTDPFPVAMATVQAPPPSQIASIAATIRLLSTGLTSPTTPVRLLTSAPVQVTS
jgi:hypothetical protein